MKAVVLFAHGSRDPLWHQPIQAVAQRIATRSPHTSVRCAYLELTEPDLPTVAAELATAGATSLCVVPMFLGVGRHAREDLPQLMAQIQVAHPHLHISCLKAVGEQDALLDLMAEIAINSAKA